MPTVKGEQVLISFLKAGEYLPYGCARSITLNLTADFIGKSTIGSGNWKEKEVVALDWNFTIEGVMDLGSSGYFLPQDVYKQWAGMLPVLIEFTLTDDDGNEIIANGEALITAVSTNGAVNNSASFNITGEGTGTLSISNLVILNEQKNVPSTGQTTLTFSFEPIAGATGYTIKYTDLGTSVAVDNTGGPAPRDIVVTTRHNYSFMLKAEPAGSFGPALYWP